MQECRTSFRRYELRLEPDEWHAVVEADWRGALVMLECGDVDLVLRHGGRRHFRQGAVLWFEGLGLHALHNPGDVPAVIVGFSRRPDQPGFR